MRKGKPKSFLKSYLDHQRSTHDTLNVIRDLNRATNDLQYAQEDREYESIHGPRTPKEKFQLGLRRFGSAVGFEVELLGVAVLQLLIIIVCNIVGFIVLFWLFSLLI